MKRSLNGSDRDFEVLIKRYSKKLYLFIFNQTRNNEDTEDIIQDTFLKAYKNLAAYDPTWKFSTWIYTIAGRTAVSHFRYENIRNREPLIPLSSSATPEEEMMKGELNSLWEAAGKLSPVKSEVIRLRYGDGLTIKEIGRITGKSAVNIRVLLYRAKNELIRILNITGEIGNVLQNDPKESML